MTDDTFKMFVAGLVGFKLGEHTRPTPMPPPQVIVINAGPPEAPHYREPVKEFMDVPEVLEPQEHWAPYPDLDEHPQV